jgi:hypothetical protein
LDWSGAGETEIPDPPQEIRVEMEIREGQRARCSYQRESRR